MFKVWVLIYVVVPENVTFPVNVFVPPIDWVPVVRTTVLSTLNVVPDKLSPEPALKVVSVFVNVTAVVFWRLRVRVFPLTEAFVTLFCRW